jgi:hypothetical protein
MHVLRQYVDRVEGLMAFAEAAASNPVAQGIVLDALASNDGWIRK